MSLHMLIITTLILLIIVISLAAHLTWLFLKERESKEISRERLQCVERKIDEIIFGRDDSGAYLPSKDIRKTMNREGWY
jgi:hypothetical protein